MTDNPSSSVPVSKERITAAAILESGVVYTGPHHAAIIHYVSRCAGIKPVKGEQGFVTSTGRFVDPQGSGRHRAGGGAG
jgi:hypothetical protein